jgi:hypothetical protein
MLLYLAFNAIHGPVQAPPDYLAKYASIPDLNRRTIAASVNCMDTAIGRVLAALDSAGIANNTLVVWFGDKGGDKTKGSLNDPLRGTKGDGYDGAIREPAGIRWPGVLPAGAVSELFNMTDDPYETSDLTLGGNAAAYSGILSSLTSAITGIAVENYPPYIGPPLITNTVAQGGSITLYAPFTSYKAPTVQWRKNGATISGGTITQVTDTLGALVVGTYTTTLDLTNVSAADAGSYDVVVSIHDVLVRNQVNIVFLGHDHLYGYQTLDGIVYLECPQPGTANYTALGSAGDGKYSTGTLLPNSRHIRVTVTPDQALAEYVRAYRAADETTTRHNREVSHSFTMAPRIFSTVEFTAKSAGTATFRWNAVANRTYAVQWSPDLVNWTTIDTVTPGVMTTAQPAAGRSSHVRGVTVELDESAEELILREGFSEEYGARNLERVMDRLLGTPIAEALLRGNIPAGQSLRAVAEGDSLRFLPQ